MTDVSGPTAELARFIAAAPNAAYPERVLTKAKAHVLDTLAAMVSGAVLPPGRRAAGWARTQTSRGVATIAGLDNGYAAADAALANGMCAHADETDDSHPESLSHPGCAVVPAALAVGETVRCSGARLLSAVITGYDVGTRVVLALGRPPVLTAQSSYSTHAYVGQFGSAAAAAVLHEVDERGVRHVLSYAAQSASGVTAWLRDTNHVQKAFVFAGMPATGGVRAASLVAAGCDGVDDVFDGHPNFLDAVSTRVDRKLLADALGSRFEIEQTNIKKYAVGSPAQAAVQAAEHLLRSDGVSAADAAEIEIVLPHDLAMVVNNRDMPDINVQYLVVGTLLDGGFSFAMAHDEQRMRATRVRELMNRCQLTADPDVAGVRSATVRITSASGAVAEHHVPVVRGTVADPMSETELVAKTLDLVEPVLGKRRANTLVETVQQLEQVTDVRELGALVAG